MIIDNSNDLERAAMIFSQSCKFLCRIEGMKAENAFRERCGNQIAYVEDSFAVAETEHDAAIQAIQKKY